MAFPTKIPSATGGSEVAAALATRAATDLADEIETGLIVVGSGAPAA
jgi:hypothetical protein